MKQEIEPRYNQVESEKKNHIVDVDEFYKQKFLRRTLT